jgi:hypothetical protein
VYRDLKRSNLTSVLFLFYAWIFSVSLRCPPPPPPTVAAGWGDMELLDLVMLDDVPDQVEGEEAPGALQNNQKIKKLHEL